MKYALVTGGSRGIGRAISQRLAKEGYHVLVNYQSNHAAAEETKNLITREGGQCSLLPFDVADPKAIKTTLQAWIDGHPDEHIEVLINNAGIRKDNLLIWMEAQEWSKVLQTNLDSFYHITQLLLKDMLVKKNGRIVNVVSLSGIKGLAGQVNYSAAKAGLIGATKALAQEVARKKVTVNAVAPGFIRSDMTADLDEKEHKRMIPMSRFGTPEEVAGTVAFLISPDASYITGEVISINGGLHT